MEYDPEMFGIQVADTDTDLKHTHVGSGQHLFRSLDPAHRDVLVWTNSHRVLKQARKVERAQRCRLGRLDIEDTPERSG
jgi:hypothetical protein